MRKNTNKYIFKNDFVIVLTSKGVGILIDRKNFKKIKKYCWCISKTGYAVANINGKITKMHRYVLNINNPNQIVDHINGNKLDNRGDNLRMATIKQNSRNTSVSKNNKVGVLGISQTKYGKYRARIMVDGKEIRLGNYNFLSDAITARKKAENKYFGEFAPNLCR